MEQPEGFMLMPLGHGDIIGDPMNPDHVGLHPFFNDRFDAIEVA